MLNIKPRTYNEVVCLEKCKKLKNYIPEISDTIIEDMYNFIKVNSDNVISVSPDNISFVNNSAGKIERAVPIEMMNPNLFDHIMFGMTAAFNVRNVVMPSSDGGCSSGCSSNNNNNNNNNNG